jgi:hypothetical protein
VELLDSVENLFLKVFIDSFVLSILEPGVLKRFTGLDSSVSVTVEHFSNEILGLVRDVAPLLRVELKFLS